VIINQASKAPPAFLTPNYLNSDCLAAGAISVSSGDAFKARAFDMTGSAWTSLGSSDATPEYYSFQFYTGPAKTPQLVDTIALIGFNGKDFSISYSYNGGAPTVVNVSGYAGSNYFLKLANSVMMDSVRVDIQNTQTANQEKQIGKFYVGAVIFQPPMSFYQYKCNHPDNIKTVVLADGTKDETAVYRSDSSFEMWSCSMAFRGVSAALRDQFKALKLVRPMAVMPKPGDDPGDIFIARIVPGGYDEEILAIGSDLYVVTLQIEEVGGA
jgi:hypothetical protein